MQPQNPALFFSLYGPFWENNKTTQHVKSYIPIFSLYVILYFPIPYSLKARFLNDCVSIHFISVFHNFLNIFLV